MAAGAGCAPTVVIVPDAGHDMTLSDGKLSDDYERTLVEWLIALEPEDHTP